MTEAPETISSAEFEVLRFMFLQSFDDSRRISRGFEMHQISKALETSEATENTITSLAQKHMVIRQMNSARTRVEYRLARRGVDYLTLLGLTEDTPARRFYLSRENRERFLFEVDEIETKLDKIGVLNSEKSQARAYLVAMKVLAEAPQPEDDLIWEIVARANQLAGVASLFVSLVALFVSVKH